MLEGGEEGVVLYNTKWVSNWHPKVVGQGPCLVLLAVRVQSSSSRPLM